MTYNEQETDEAEELQEDITRTFTKGITQTERKEEIKRKINMGEKMVGYNADKKRQETEEIDT